MTPEVVFEDNHLLVLFKPAGLLTQPSPLVHDSLETRAKAWLKEKYQKPGAVFLHAVHRLDAPVSGLVVFAKTSKALSRLNESMRSKQCRKIYHARIENALPHQEGTLENRLIHGEHEAKEDPSGKVARLHYKMLAPGLVEIDLETGRYHQIRVQLALAGCPIVGDSKYGARTSHPEGIALSHVKISFPHPVKEETVTFSVKPF